VEKNSIFVHTPLIFLSRIRDRRILRSSATVCRFPLFIALSLHDPPTLQTARRQTDRRTDGRHARSARKRISAPSRRLRQVDDRVTWWWSQVYDHGVGPPVRRMMANLFRASERATSVIDGPTNTSSPTDRRPARDPRRCRRDPAPTSRTDFSGDDDRTAGRPAVGQGGHAGCRNVTVHLEHRERRRRRRRSTLGAT